MLTRAEAEQRSALIRPSSSVVELELGDDPARFRSRTTLVFTALPGARTFVDVHADELTATLNGVELPDSAYSGGRLALGPLEAAGELVVDATMRYSHDGEGLVRHVDPADGRVYLYAMSFLDAAPRWFACFDQPDLKAPVTLLVRCPDGWTVVGNGPVDRLDDRTWRIAQPHPMATYYTAFAAGPYHSVRGEHDGIPLGLHARASLAPYLDRDAAALLAHTGRCFDELHQLFGVRYPWGEYHQVFVPDFNAGAMENPGCVTFDDRMLFRSWATDRQRRDRDNTIAHEMAHMWFGDLVTMRWWDDLWLNESFAEYLGHRVCAAAGDPMSWVSFSAERKSWGYTADRRPSTHPVAGNGAADTDAALADFDGISYAKGAAVLRQLATRLGDEIFLTGLRAHIGAHAHGNATLGDLLGAWREAGAADVDDWAGQWLRRAGLDRLVVRDGALIRETPGDGSDREHAVRVAAFHRSGAAVWSRPAVVRDLPIALDAPAAALVLPDADDSTWATLVLGAAEWAAASELVTRLDPTARAVLLNAARLAVADAALDPADGVALACALARGETEDVLLDVALRWATGLLDAYLAPDRRPPASAALADSALAAFSHAPAGSGLRLAALRALTELSDEPERLDVPADDVDLRWRVLLRRCVLGRADVSDIDAELARDRSAEGEQRAAQCRAARPVPEAKRAAWALLADDLDAANSVLYATARGFWQVGQEAVTDAYVEHYFAEIAEIAARRSGWVSTLVAELAYPRLAVSAETLDRTDRLLAGHLPSGVRRAVVDAGDDLRRAFTSRERYRI